ncbi:helix-turn-helix transcriptional regulator [Shigella flexneri]|nr:helix-turn-helix transcriptional regulator [Shigella flexneri]
MFGLWGGKPRTSVGKFFDARGISQEFLAAKTKINRNTISKICSEKDYKPRLDTIRKVMKVIKSIDPSAKVDDFFDL